MFFFSWGEVVNSCSYKCLRRDKQRFGLGEFDMLIYYMIYPPLFPLFYGLTRLLRADFDTNVPLFGVAFVLMVLCRNLSFSVIFLAL